MHSPFRVSASNLMQSVPRRILGRVTQTDVRHLDADTPRPVLFCTTYDLVLARSSVNRVAIRSMPKPTQFSPSIPWYQFSSQIRGATCPEVAIQPHISPLSKLNQRPTTAHQILRERPLEKDKDSRVTYLHCNATDQFRSRCLVPKSSYVASFKAINHVPSKTMKSKGLHGAVRLMLAMTGRKYRCSRSDIGYILDLSICTAF